MKHALNEIQKFAEEETNLAKHAFKTPTEREALMVKVEIKFLIDACGNENPTYGFRRD